LFVSDTLPVPYSTLMNAPRPAALLFLQSLILAAGCYGAVASAQAAPLGAFPNRSQWNLRTTSTNGGYLFRDHDGVLLHNGAFSYDGVTFSNFSDPPFAYWQNVTGYGGGTFVKTGAVGQIFTSGNGTTWTNRSPGGEDIVGVRYGNGVFVARKYWSTGSLWVSSNNGVSWSSVTTGSNPGREYLDFSFGNGKFIIPLDNRVRMSTDGFNWTEHTVATVPAGFALRNARYFDGNFFVGAAEKSRTGSSVTILTARSQDGISWEYREAVISSTSAATFYSEGVGAGYLMIVSGSDPAEAWSSHDYGHSWTKVDGPWANAGNRSAFFSATGNVLAVVTDSGIYSHQFTGTPVIENSAASSITATSATLGGNVTADGGATITERGVVYSATATNADPVIGGTGVTKVPAAGTTGVFTASATGLTRATGYSYKAYAINNQGTTYSSVATFTTSALPPSVTSPTSSAVTATGATLGGNVTNDGGATITERGVVYSASTANADPIIGGTGVTKVTTTGTTGAFTIPLTSLSGEVNYRFKAYATNSKGTSYSSVASFLTLSDNADLKSLVLDGFTFSPAFSAATGFYATTVQRSDGTVRVRPSSAHAGVSLFARVNGGGWLAMESGDLSLPLTLQLGENTVEVRVIAEGGTTEKTYTLEIFRNDPRPDAMVGSSLAFMGGGNFYSGSSGQQLRLTSPKARPVTAYAAVTNRGNRPDAFAWRGSGDTRHFRVEYRDATGALVSAAVRAGLYHTPERQPDDPSDWLRIIVTPERRLLVVSQSGRTRTLRKVHTVLLNASSVADPALRDGVSVWVETR
jgi:hypothetical protein